MAKKKTETERPTLVYHGEFGDTQVILKSDTYTTGNLYLGLCKKTEEGLDHFADITVNMPYYLPMLDSNEVFVSGDLGDHMLRFIRENKLGRIRREPVTVWGHGYRIAALNMKRLAQFDPEGITAYLEAVS